jgi:hypothetical protein
MVNDPTMPLEMGGSRQLLCADTSVVEPEILKAASVTKSLRATSEIRNIVIQSPVKATGAGLGRAMSPRESWNPTIEKIVSDSQIERVRPGDIEGSVSDPQIGVSEIEKSRRAPLSSNAFRKEEIETEDMPSQLPGENARQFESQAMPSQMPQGVSESEQDLLSESIVIKHFSESGSLAKSQQGGIQPDCHEGAYRLCQSDFPKATGAGLGKTMPLRTLSIQKTSDVTKIWEEAERRLGASRTNFSLVRSRSRYLPLDGFLEVPEPLFEIRWRSRGGSSKFTSSNGGPKEVHRDPRRSGEQCVHDDLLLAGSKPTGGQVDTRTSSSGSGGVGNSDWGVGNVRVVDGENVIGTGEERISPPEARLNPCPLSIIRKFESAIRCTKASLKKMQEGLAAAKEGFTGRKHKRHEEEALSFAIDVQCGEKRTAVKYSKKWQKMRRRIIQEFDLKWRKWALFQRNPETSEWDKLSLPHGSLTPEASYRVVLRPKNRDKKPRPGLGEGWSAVGLRGSQEFRFRS